jgi:hypothetical protein
MHNVGIDVRCIEINATPHRTEGGSQWFWATEIARVQFVTCDFQPALLKVLIAEAANIDLDGLRQFAREITNVHAGTAINVRWIFVCEETNLHIQE